MKARAGDAAETPLTAPDVDQGMEAPGGYEEFVSPKVRDQTVPLTEKLALSVEETGVLLGISRDLAYDLVARGELPSVKLGRRLVVPRRALEEALDRLVEAG
jgi:excisionase family DNA binding protein